MFDALFVLAATFNALCLSAWFFAFLVLSGPRWPVAMCAVIAIVLPVAAYLY